MSNIGHVMQPINNTMSFRVLPLLAANMQSIQYQSMATRVKTIAKIEENKINTIYYISNFN